MTFAEEDRAAAMAVLSRIETMDVALLGSLVCCAFHVWVRRLRRWKGEPSLTVPKNNTHIAHISC